jgi:hypothetical protein
MRNGCGMQSFDPGEAGKILRVKRQDFLHSVDAHDGDEMSVVHLDARDAIIHEQSTPFFVCRQAIGK